MASNGKKNPGGRPPPLLVQQNFSVIEKVDNKSNRYWLKCNHCPDGGPGSRIQGRDNNHIKHLMDPKKCPRCPVDIRKEARLFLAGKGIMEPPVDGSITSPSSPTISAESGVVTVTKKRKGMGSLDGYVDHALTPGQQLRANVKLFRYVNGLVLCGHGVEA